MRGDTQKVPNEHLEWLALVDVSGPFLTVPVLRRIWPTLEALDKPTRDALGVAHTAATDDPRSWIDWVLAGLLGWGDALVTRELDELAMEVPEHEARLRPDFALREPSTGECRLLGVITAPGQHPAARIHGDAWAATPIDRTAMLCRQHGIELGLATGGRWWALVWAPRGKVTSTAVFDSITWTDSADRVVVRAFRSLLERRRFFGVPQAETLPPLFTESVDNQEEVTETLGIQVRRAVELLVDAIGREDLRAQAAGRPGLDAAATAHDVYRGTVAVMMRVVFLLFAEERGLLPSDSSIYGQSYSAGRLCEELEQRVADSSEEVLEQSGSAWQRLLALFTAVHRGVAHPELTLPAYDGSLFDPAAHPWLADVVVDDRTVLHMLRAVQYVTIRKERRRLSFRALDVEQIGYVYEGLLSFDGFRADTTYVGLVGKEGLEAEVRLDDLERIAADYTDLTDLAAAFAERYKDSKIGSSAAVAKRLYPLQGAEQTEALRLLLAATSGDRLLADQLLAFFGIIRRDLRGLPTVILPGSLYVTESPLRRTTGTHYTPRFLAEQIIEGALEPLIYAPGPLQTADRAKWRLRSNSEILTLRIADIAMGSGAFLVAACRYLARALVQAWSNEGDARAKQHVAADPIDAPADVEADPVVIEARREIISHCLYGVDINPMAVEMAKLSLWLVSMDPTRPFTFLDDRLVTGDSLLGVASIDQIEAMHMDAHRGRKLHDKWAIDYTEGIRERIAEIAELRRELAGLPGNTLCELHTKRQALAEVDARTKHMRLLGDLAVGAALANAKRGQNGMDDGSIEAVALARETMDGDDHAEAKARRQADRWLVTDQPAEGFAGESLHWPVTFAEVFEAGGFDAIVGNPPFLGGKKISGALGSSYREFLVHTIGRGVKGHADLIAFFVLRAHRLLNSAGQAGLIATNTLAQGDTREVGLDQILAGGVEIRRAIKSERWPSKSAALQYCAVWTSRAAVARSVPRLIDDQWVRGISSTLDPQSRVNGPAYRLAENAGLSYIGSYALGMGFTMEPREAMGLIAQDPRNREVLFPYLNGEDLNARPDSSASRWIINFFDWPIERAAQYQDVMSIIEHDVRPERQRRKPDGDFVLRRPLPHRYWHYADKRPALYRLIKELDRVIVITLHTKFVMPVMVPTHQVFSHGLGVFAVDDFAMLGMLSSAPHYWWAITYGSTIGEGARYTPTDVFETFPRPELTAGLRAVGERLDDYRRGLMLARNTGLTRTYNLAHNPDCHDEDIAELRRIHVAIDEAVFAAYGWKDLEPCNGFYETRQGVRHTVEPATRQEMLDRLLELNHERYAGQQARIREDASGTEQGEMFG